METGTANADNSCHFNIFPGNVLQISISVSSAETGNYAFKESEKKNQNEER